MNDGKHRYQYLIIGLAVAFLLLAAQLFRLQLLDNSFKISAENNALLYQTRHPARGLILDRNGKILVGNKNTYDILVTPRYVKPFDTLELCRILDLDPQYVRDKFSEYRMYRTRIGYRTVTFVSQISQEQYSRFIEVAHKFPEFRGVPRTTRMYPYNAGGNLLGYVTEVDRDFLDRHPDYAAGDYTGRTGLEETCEPMLRGEKGYSIYLRDASNRPRRQQPDTVLLPQRRIRQAGRTRAGRSLHHRRGTAELRRGAHAQQGRLRHRHRTVHRGDPVHDILPRNRRIRAGRDQQIL